MHSLIANITLRDHACAVTETNDTAAAKLLALLEVLAQSDTDTGDGLTVAEIARALGRDKSIVSRQLKPMVELGLVERNGEGRHRLGWRLFAVAARAGDQRLLLLTPPVMRRLTQLVRERVHLSIRRGPEVFTILSESPNRMIEVTGWVGRTTPVTCTSSGRALLFDHSDEEIRELLDGRFQRGSGPQAARNVEELIERVAVGRQRGFALVADEFDDDITAVASPVRDVHGRIVAAVNISAPSYRLKDHVGTAGRHVSQAALHLSRALSSPPDPPETTTA
jgi:IclR family KDG regulon transcriptional repressor